MLTRRQTLVTGLTSLGSAGLLGTGQTASAADVFPRPGKPVTLISNFAPGGIEQKAMLDFQPFFEKELQTRVLVETIPGAAGIIAYNTIYARPADGYNILPCSSTFGPYIYPYLSEAPTPWKYEDWLPLGIYSDIPNSGMVVLKNSPYQTFPDFIKAAKANPGKITVGTIGPGRVEDIQIVELQNFFGIKIRHVYYDSDGTLYTDLLTGDLDVIINAAIRYAEVPGARIMTMLAKHMTDNFPFKQLHTMADWQSELHYKVEDLKTLGMTQFNGMMVRVGTPDFAYQRLILALKNVVSNPEWKAKVASYRYPVYYPPEKAKVLYDELNKDIQEMARQVKKA